MTSAFERNTALRQSSYCTMPATSREAIIDQATLAVTDHVMPKTA